MQIISLVNQKGGCGKTTSAVNLAYALSLKGFQVLLIDFDPQAHATFSLGISPLFSITDLLEKIFNRQPIKIEDFLLSRHKSLWVLASNMELSVVEHFQGEKKDKLEMLKKLLTENNLRFDYCIIDCPPNLGFLTLNALICSHYAIVPIGICELSLQGVTNLINILDITSMHTAHSCILYYLITQLDRRFKFSQAFLEKARNRFNDQLLTTMIRTNIHLREAACQGKSIYEYKKDSRGAEDYIQLAQELNKITGIETQDSLTMKAQDKEMSNRIRDDLEVKLLFKARDANEVFVVGEFNNWQLDNEFRLKKLEDDTWYITLALKKGTYRYKFIVDGTWINDPANPLEEKDPFGGRNSILSVD